MKIEWKGGECPVSADTMVKIYRRDGGALANVASMLTWIKTGSSADIIAYEILDPRYVSPIVPDEYAAPFKKITVTGHYPKDQDPVNHPQHYTNHPSGIECIQITEHMTFCLGNAVKYIWRADLKHDAVQDLEKAKWYIEREIVKRKGLK